MATATVRDRTRAVLMPRRGAIALFFPNAVHVVGFKEAVAIRADIDTALALAANPGGLPHGA